MADSIIKQLQHEFIQEARSAPKLFRDLAKVEQYIAESYKTRALIELIQNADDANSQAFGIYSFDKGFAVGNNGREFTPEDIEALCRSGSSNKYRGGETIGYRGIGFKSVVNLAKRIYIFSGNFSFCFDKSRTQKALGSESDVPLIRIPHLLEDSDQDLRKEALDLAAANSYRTVFVFQGDLNNLTIDELSEFDKSSLIFLNNLSSLKVDWHDLKRYICLENSILKNNSIIKIIESSSCDEWEVECSSKNRTSRVSFKRQDGSIIPALPQESVIHSFTPTNEFSGAYIKINGDFSTDPSRKTIDIDSLSEAAFHDAVWILVQGIIGILEGDLSRRGFFSPFVSGHPQESGRFKAILIKLIKTFLQESKFTRDEHTWEFVSIRTRPTWLNYEDYEILCISGIYPIHKQTVTAYPEINSFLDIISVQKITLEEIRQRINSVRISNIGYAQVFAKFVNQYRFDMGSSLIEEFKRLQIFPTTEGIVTADSVSSSGELVAEYKNYLGDNLDKADLTTFTRKLGIAFDKFADNQKSSQVKQGNSSDEISLDKQSINHDLPGESQASRDSNFRVKPSIKKWRSAETNAAEFFKALNTVLGVEDVTQANLGYDLEILLESGRKLLVEVKSVSSFSEAFKITNNEYSSAHNYGDDYYIALVINSEDFQLRLIRNPIKELKFEKKCERWSWHCSEYSSSLFLSNELFL